MKSASEAPTLVKAKTLSMQYVPAEIDYEYGVKRHEIYKRCIKGGRRVIGGGNGQYVTSTYSHFILKVQIEGSEIEIWTERTFKEELGRKRLTAKLREQIESTMPKNVELEKCISARGTEYWTLTSETARQWAKIIKSS